MGLLDEMDSYLGLDELNERQKVLDVMSHEQGGKPFYMVGRRALNSKGGGSAFKVSPGVSHEHFVRSDGVGNFGFAPNGMFTEPQSKLEDYELTDEYGTRKYDAGLLDQIVAGLGERRDAIEQTAEDLGLQEHIFPAMHEVYSFPTNNCKHFVGNMDYLYRLAGGKYQ